MVGHWGWVVELANESYSLSFQVNDMAKLADLEFQVQLVIFCFVGIAIEFIFGYDSTMN
jgi:hypothetical protein